MEEYIDNGRQFTSCTTCRGLKFHCEETNLRSPVPRVGYWRISMVHRIGVKPKIQGEDKRNMFKLCNRDLKQNILKCFKVVKPKKFYVNESLTPQRNTILYVMWQAKKKHSSVINSCNSSDGSVLAWLHAASGSAKTKYQKIIINTKQELDLFLQQELNTKATSFNVLYKGNC